MKNFDEVEIALLSCLFMNRDAIAMVLVYDKNRWLYSFSPCRNMRFRIIMCTFGDVFRFKQ